jgi:hypothetical protein
MIFIEVAASLTVVKCHGDAGWSSAHVDPRRQTFIMETLEEARFRLRS